METHVSGGQSLGGYTVGGRRSAVGDQGGSEAQPDAPTTAPPSLAHQFDDIGQQRETATLGMWIFLATEFMFFGGLFMAYIAYRYLYPQAFAEGSQHLKNLLGGANTGILLSSSLTMALAVHAVHAGRRGATVAFLLLTMALGAVFLGIKGYEYFSEYQEGLVPALNFTFDGAQAQQVKLFFILYFLMTGLHAIHMTIGMCVVLAMAVLAWRRRFSPEYYTPVELVGLYWHFVDIIWVFLYPLLYLIKA
jgi:cytochrome c oxidase subunit 3